MFDPIPLERPQIVGVAEFRSQPLEDCPVVFLPFAPHRLFKMALEVGSHPIIVEEGVVDVRTEKRGSVLSWAHPLACITCVDLYATRMICVSRAEDGTRRTHQERA